MEEVKYDLKQTGASRRNLYFAVFVANLGAFTTGFVLGWSSPFVVLLQAPDSVLPVTQHQGAWLASLVPLGMIFGPFLCGRLLDTIGRRWTILCYLLMILASWGLMCVWEVWFLYAGRFLMGVAEGISLAVTSVYVAEISEDSVRSMLNTLSPMFKRVPILISFLLAPHLHYHGFILMACSPIIIFLLLYKTLPESPHYLVLRNREDEAIKALSWLRQLPDSSTVEEVKLIKESISTTKLGSWKDLFTKRGSLKAILILCSLHTFQQVSGGIVIFFYAETIFKLSKISMRTDLCASLIAAMMIIGTSLSPALVRRWGYKKPLFASTFGSALALGSLAYFLEKCESGNETEIAHWAVVVSLSTYEIINMIGLGPMPWAMTGEYFSPSMKAKGSTMATCVFSAEAFVLIKLFPYAISLWGLTAICWFGCGVLVLATLFVVIFVPETSGLSFAEIQDIFNG